MWLWGRDGQKWCRRSSIKPKGSFRSDEGQRGEPVHEGGDEELPTQ